MRKKIYIPYMCDHAYALEAAFQAFGIDAEVMPETDAESVDIGRSLVTGKECYPCLLTTGDMIKVLKRPDFDRKNSVFFMPTGRGPCRFGNYYRLHRIILDEIGYHDVPIMSPDQDDEDYYGEMSMLGDEFASLVWRGIVSIDLLDKKLRQTRPYEVKRGESERVYNECLQEIKDTIRRKADPLPVLIRARERFESIGVSLPGTKPLVGVVGEIYVRSNRFSNEHIVKRLEENGAEVMLPPITEWILYSNFTSRRRSRSKGRWGILIKNLLKVKYQEMIERKYTKIFEGSLRHAHEPSIDELLKMASPYIHDSFEGEAILSVGKAIDYIRKGASGIVNTSPFQCMPGTVTSGIFKRLKDEHKNIPVLNLFYDGQEDASFETKIEAFMYQVYIFHKRYGSSAGH